jgi:hypothetical protein
VLEELSRSNLGSTNQLGLSKPVNAAYLGLAVRAKRDRPILGAPLIPTYVLEDLLKNMKLGDIVVSADPPARMPIAFSLAHQTRTREFYGEDEKFLSYESLNEG